MSKRLHPKTRSELLDALDSDSYVQEIVDLLEEHTPAADGAYVWPISEAVIISRWLQQEDD